MAGIEVKPDLEYADTTGMMTLGQLMRLLLSVLISPQVIGVTVVIALYINIVNYIVRYRKQAPKPKQPRIRAAAAVAPPPDEDEEPEIEDDEDALPSPKKKKKRK